MLFEAALELDGQLPMALSWLGYCRAARGRLEEAVLLFEQAAARGLVVGLAYLANVLPRLGHIEPARAAVTKLEGLAVDRYISPIYLGLAYAGLDQRDHCFQHLARSLDDRSPTMTLTLLGKATWRCSRRGSASGSTPGAARSDPGWGCPSIPIDRMCRGQHRFGQVAF